MIRSSISSATQSRQSRQPSRGAQAPIGAVPCRAAAGRPCAGRRRGIRRGRKRAGAGSACSPRRRRRPTRGPGCARAPSSATRSTPAEPSGATGAVQSMSFPTDGLQVDGGAIVSRIFTNRTAAQDGDANASASLPQPRGTLLQSGGPAIFRTFAARCRSAGRSSRRPFRVNDRFHRDLAIDRNSPEGQPSTAAIMDTFATCMQARPDRSLVPDGTEGCATLRHRVKLASDDDHLAVVLRVERDEQPEPVRVVAGGGAVPGLDPLRCLDP